MINKLLYIIVISLMICPAANNELYSQKAVVLTQGKITDEFTGKPVGTQMIFIPEKGKIVSCTANADGTYQTVLLPGNTYKVIFKGYMLSQSTQQIELPNDEKFKELKVDFLVHSFKPGETVLSFKAFQPNDTMLTNTFSLQYLKLFFDFNPSAKIEVSVSSIDSWFSATNKKVEVIGKKGKKTTKTVKYTSKELLSELLNSRIRVLKNLLKSNDVFLKDNAFVKDLKVIPDKNKKQKRLIPGTKNKYEYFIPDNNNVTIKIAGR